HNLTPAGRIKKPSYSLVFSWVKITWKKVNSILICKSFKCCGISVKVDGSEDDMIFDYDNLIDENQENKLLDEMDENDDNEGNDNNENEYNNWSSLNFV
ncbi:12628_t:CDS:1, partial [Funneliformis geosporum]